MVLSEQFCAKLATLKEKYPVGWAIVYVFLLKYPRKNPRLVRRFLRRYT